MAGNKVRVQCPSCQAVYLVPAKMNGKRFTCKRPSCGRRIRLEVASHTPAPAQLDQDAATDPNPSEVDQAVNEADVVDLLGEVEQPRAEQAGIKEPATNSANPGTAEQPPPAPQGTPEPSQPARKPCPYCSEEILATARKCKHCGEFLDQAKPMPAEPVQSQAPIQVLGDGHFVFSGPYEQAFALVERAMQECGAKIKDSSLPQGLIKAKCKYGINPFGITVTATFYSDGGGTHAELAATLTDAMDTFGACKKKVNEIAERVRSLAMTTTPQPAEPIAAGPPPLPGQRQQAPTYANRTGPSYRGKATTGFILSLIGLFVGILSIVGLILSSSALNAMSTAGNDDGKGLATAGLVIGIIGVLGWLAFLATL